uniref:Uncharacterized protein n=1 Tax=Anguilla anguilla TaxID=7936 RepID=A0A0E9QFC6_ANGAN
MSLQSRALGSSFQ